jgi:hypothetical protein
MASNTPLTTLTLRLKGVNYLQVAGNRFARELADIPAGMAGDSNSRLRASR